MIYKISIQTKDLNNLEVITKELSRLYKVGIITKKITISELINPAIIKNTKTQILS